MDRNVVIGIIVLVLILLGGWFFINQSRTQPQPAPATTLQPSPSAAAEVTVTLNEQNNSGQSGTATLREENGQLKVSLNLTAGASGVSQPAHIHDGACPKVGEVKYPLDSLVDGKSETTLSTTLETLKSELPLAINVHKSATQAAVYTACGDLSL